MIQYEISYVSSVGVVGSSPPISQTKSSKSDKYPVDAVTSICSKLTVVLFTGVVRVSFTVNFSVPITPVLVPEGTFITISCSSMLNPSNPAAPTTQGLFNVKSDDFISLNMLVSYTGKQENDEIGSPDVDIVISTSSPACRGVFFSVVNEKSTEAAAFTCVGKTVICINIIANNKIMLIVFLVIIFSLDFIFVPPYITNS